MDKTTIRRAVFREIKEHHHGISTRDLTLVTNSDINEVSKALEYFKSNAIVKEKEFNGCKRWFIEV